MSGGLAAANVALLGSVAEDVGLWKVDEVDVTSELPMLLGKGDGLGELLMRIAPSAIVSTAVALAEEERLVLLVGNAAVDVVKTNRFMVEYGETVAVAEVESSPFEVDTLSCFIVSLRLFAIPRCGAPEYKLHVHAVHLCLPVHYG